jgi:hypothetical protein
MQRYLRRDSLHLTVSRCAYGALFPAHFHCLLLASLVSTINQRCPNRQETLKHLQAEYIYALTRGAARIDQAVTCDCDVACLVGYHRKVNYATVSRVTPLILSMGSRVTAAISSYAPDELLVSRCEKCPCVKQVAPVAHSVRSSLVV